MSKTTGGPCCTHLTVSWRTEDVPYNGPVIHGPPDSPHAPLKPGMMVTQGWWECDFGCGAKFTPVPSAPTTPPIISNWSDAINHLASASERDLPAPAQGADEPGTAMTCTCFREWEDVKPAVCPDCKLPFKHPNLSVAYLSRLEAAAPKADEQVVELAYAKCLEVERTSPPGEVATLAALACSAALRLAQSGPYVRHHVEDIHRLVDHALRAVEPRTDDASSLRALSIVDAAARPYLSVRTASALGNYFPRRHPGWPTIGEVIDATDDELLLVPNIGPVAVEEVHRLRASLAPAVPQAAAPTPSGGHAQ